MSTRDLIAFCFVVLALAFLLDDFVACAKNVDNLNHQENILRIEKQAKQ